MRALHRILLAAVALGSFAAAVVPSEAQLVQRHNDGSISINPLLCFTDYQVRQAVAAQGFSDIKLNQPLESHQRVHASRGGHALCHRFRHLRRPDRQHPAHQLIRLPPIHRLASTTFLPRQRMLRRLHH